MTALAPALSAALLHFVWQGALVAMVVSVALALLRKRSANARYLTACAGLALMAALPVVTTLALLGPQQPVVSAQPVTANAVIKAPAPVAPLPLDLAQSLTLRIWSCGLLVFALRLVLSYGHVMRLRHTGEPAEPSIVARAAGLAARMNIGRRVVVLVSRIADCPSVTGWLRPAILLPAAVLAGLDADQLEAILAHELAHIRRHDYLVNLLQTIAETVLFYHPAVWWLSTRIRREREFCCDDLAVRYCSGAMGYARALTSLERLRTAPVLTPAGNGGSLLFRIRRLMGEGADAAPSRLPAIAALAIAAVCLGGSVHWARGQSQNSSGILFRAPVTYPEIARAKGIEGTVYVEVTLNGEGGVTDARVLTGASELRRSALSSILNWRFANAVAAEVRQVPIEFKKEMPSGERGVFFFDTPNNRNLIWNGPEQQQGSSSAAQLQRDEGRLAELRAQIRELESQLDREHQQLQQRKGQLQETATASESAAMASLDETRAQLLKQQSLLGALSNTLGPNNPSMLETKSHIRELEAQLAQQEAAIVTENQDRARAEPLGIMGRRLAHIFLTPTVREPPITPELRGARTPALPFPLRVGDTWAADSQTKLDDWAKSVHGEPSCKFSIDAEGGISLVITLQ